MHCSDEIVHSHNIYFNQVLYVVFWIPYGNQVNTYPVKRKTNAIFIIPFLSATNYIKTIIDYLVFTENATRYRNSLWLI